MTQVITKEYVFDTVIPTLNKLISLPYVIAGGCPRDLHYGVPVKDIDVYINGYGTPELLHALRPLGKLITVRKNDVTYNAEVFDVEGSPLQFICSPIDAKQGSYVEELLGTFDFGICRIAYTPRKEIIYTEEFLVDDNNETITLCHMTPETFLKSVNDHLPRLQAKYPERKLDVPVLSKRAILLSEKDVA